jgi:hypothetical protein
MAYGKVLGRLSIIRRGKPRKDTRSGNCVHCKLPVTEGTVHFILQRTVKLKTTQIVWITKRLHQPCFPLWLEHAEEWLIENEKKAASKRTGRPRVILSNLSAEDLVARNKMLKRQSHCLNRLLQNPQYDQETKEEIESEIKELTAKINEIAPCHYFGTKKRKERSLSYKRATGSMPNV